MTPGDAGNGSVRNRAFRAERNRPTLLLHRFFSSVDPSHSDFCLVSYFKEERRKRLESYSFTFM